MNKQMYYVKHQVYPDASDAATKGVLQNIKQKLYVYIPFRVNHYIFDSDLIRKECGVFVIKEIKNPLSIVSELTLVKTRSNAGFNKLTLTLLKTENNKKIIKRANLVFSKDYYTPQLAKKIASVKKVSYEQNVNWTIVAITGPKERFKLKIVDPVDSSTEEEEKK